MALSSKDYMKVAISKVNTAINSYNSNDKPAQLNYLNEATKYIKLAVKLATMEKDNNTLNKNLDTILK